MRQKKRVTIWDVMESDKQAQITAGTWDNYHNGGDMTAGQAIITIVGAIIAIPLAFVLAILSLAKGS